MDEIDSTYLLAFSRITKAISSSPDLREVPHLIVKTICETTGSKGCTLMLLDERERRLEVKSSFGLSDRYLQKGPLLSDRSIAGGLNGDTVIIEDATRDTRVQYPEEARLEGIASIVSIPIVQCRRIIGALRLYTSVPCKFSQEDIVFLSAVAVLSGFTVGNGARR